jgi:hypothetical protein
MNKDFIPYQEALELKQLGFDELCFGWYDCYSKTVNYEKAHNSCGWLNGNHCSAPTYSQAFRWFREKHGISIYVSPLEDGSAFYYMVYTNINVPYSNRICSLPSKWNTYEEAELECLKRLIEIVKEQQK